MIRGSCLCGEVRWGVDDGAFTDMSHCHCSMCRKSHGAAFATYAGAPRASFHWLAGESGVTRYESSPGFVRGFCARCGSVAPDFSGSVVYVPVGCLDDDPVMRPSSHIFVAAKAPWHEISDDLPQHTTRAAGQKGAVIDRPAARPARAGVLRGSCLCGAVAYEVSEPLKAIYNCHCSRCRKARAAAHATNGFTSAAGLVFVRGADTLVTYRLPEARYFSQVFCPTCGSKMPRIDDERGIAVIPLGSLDDDPGRGADDHIFVDFKAPWYTITGDIPRHAERPPA